ncbi:hypothetical protein SAMN05192588_1906 [Nonlabens sp. Hel1_33_55]|uniref:hypothetical protein n=1 Tax=Nonlabens sp. Hel1_33_55 TaxID=1336802 RepID=UPI000875EFAF|nr:hypothetical protein [Nonlabens sp. Hel1_33_55]SCY25620.1 hypothetical protein SAMN05192588_1906 [Nonlabens sp. Hel1_33_55]
MKKYIFPSATLLIVLYTKLYWFATFSNYKGFPEAKEGYFNHFGLTSADSTWFSLSLLAILIASFIYVALMIKSKVPRIIFIVLHSLLLLIALWELM